jgi:hypothetical protein
MYVINVASRSVLLSLIKNVMYYINSPQTTLGTQDILDYNFCWVSGMGNCTKYQ